MRQILPALRGLYSRLPETCYLSYTDDLTDEAARGDWPQWAAT